MVPEIHVMMKMYWLSIVSLSVQKFSLLHIIDNKIDGWDLINPKCERNYVSTLGIVVSIKDLMWS